MSNISVNVKRIWSPFPQKPAILQKKGTSKIVDTIEMTETGAGRFFWI